MAIVEPNGNNSSNGGSIPAAYVIVPDGLGGAVANACDAGLSNITGANPVTVFQGAINALAVQNGGKGGRVAFKGQHVWASQVTLYPGISLTGDGPLANKSIQETGSTIQSTFNGVALLLTGLGASNKFFPALADFTMFGDNGGTKAAQVLVQIDASGGADLFDVFVSRVLTFDGGLYNFYVNQAGKVWFNDCYAEGCAGDNFRLDGGSSVEIDNCYIFGATLNGVNVVNVASLALLNSRIWSNAQGSVTSYGLHLQRSAVAIVLGNDLDSNGGANNYSTRIGVTAQVQGLAMNANNFRDSRGAGAVNHHISVAPVTACVGSITGNNFSGQKTGAISVAVNVSNRLVIAANPGYNDTFGVIATPFHATGPFVGLGGNAAAPTASTTYQNVTAPLFLNIAGGTGVSITITDAAGNTIVAGLTTYTGPLPVGCKINFGAFSVAPATCYVGLV